MIVVAPGVGDAGAGEDGEAVRRAETDLGGAGVVRPRGATVDARTAMAAAASARGRRDGAESWT